MIWSTRRYTAEDTTVYSSACEDSDEGRFRSASVLCDILVMTVLGTEWRSLLLLDMGGSLWLDASVMDEAVCFKKIISF